MAELVRRPLKEFGGSPDGGLIMQIVLELAKASVICFSSASWLGYNLDGGRTIHQLQKKP